MFVLYKQIVCKVLYSYLKKDYGFLLNFTCQNIYKKFYKKGPYKKLNEQN